MKKSWIPVFITTALLISCKDKHVKSPKTDKAETTKNASPADQKFSLNYKLTLGESYPLTLKTTQKITQTLEGGKSEQVTQSSGLDLSFKVKEEKEDRYICEAVYKSIQTKMSNQAGSMAINTAEKRPSNETALLWDAMKAITTGKSLTVELMKNGTITNVKGFDKIYQEVRARLKKQLPPQNLENLILMLQQNFSEEAFKKNYEQSRMNLPDHTITIGESWEKKTDETIAGQGKKGTETYTLKEVKDGIARIDVNISIDKISQESKNKTGTEKFSLSGSQKGTIMIHVGTGWIKKSELTQNMKGSISAHSGEKKLFEIPMSIEGSVNVKGI